MCVGSHRINRLEVSPWSGAQGGHPGWEVDGPALELVADLHERATVRWTQRAVRRARGGVRRPSLWLPLQNPDTQKNKYTIPQDRFPMFIACVTQTPHTHVTHRVSVQHDLKHDHDNF